ncbi:MAG: FmdB family zinc ribbon protein [Acidimicrobiales bacterium]
MPTYEYRCKSCSRELEIVQSFTDDALTTCEACGGQLRKLFGNVGIAFKGTGFYKNDSREKAKSTAKNGDKISGDKAGSDKGSGDKAGSDKSSGDKSGSSKEAGSSGGGKTDAATTTSTKKSATSTTTKGS